MNLRKSEWIKATTTKSAYWLYGLGIVLALGLAAIIGQFEQSVTGDPMVGDPRPAASSRTLSPGMRVAPMGGSVTPLNSVFLAPSPGITPI